MTRLAAALLLVLLPGLAPAAPRVVADIAPVHALVAWVMAGIGVPALLIPPGVSEHDYALRPSEAALLSEADIVIVIGPVLTPWIARPLQTLSPKAYVIELAEVPGLPMPPAATGSDGGAGHDEGQDAGHGTSGGNPHFWLNPAAAIVWLPVIADALAERDPGNTALYRANADAAVAELLALDRAVAGRMAALRGRGYVVFHDAYAHFEARYGLTHAGAIALSDAGGPGVARMVALRDALVRGSVVCVFTEPQFSPRLAEQLVEGTAARLGTLDATGAALVPGPALYPALIEGLAAGFERCLAP